MGIIAKRQLKFNVQQILYIPNRHYCLLRKTYKQLEIFRRHKTLFTNDTITRLVRHHPGARKTEPKQEDKTKEMRNVSRSSNVTKAMCH